MVPKMTYLPNKTWILQQKYMEHNLLWQLQNTIL